MSQSVSKPRASIALCALLAFVALAPAGRPAAARKKPAACKAQSVPKLAGPMVDAFAAWKKTHVRDEPYAGTLYSADVNNDGRPELVELSYQGSGGYLDIDVYRPAEGSFAALPSVPAPKGSHGDGGWYSHESADPATGQSQLLVQICDDVYLSFSDVADGSREGYLWKNGETVRACSAAWAGFQLSDFQTLYDRRLYDFAKNDLESLLDGCAARLDAETRLRALSDLAVTHFHLGDFAACGDDVAYAKKDPAFGSSKNKAALLHNEALCAAAVPATNDFGPLLAATDGAGDDARTEALLAATVPALSFDAGQPDSRLARWIGAGLSPGGGAATSHMSFDLRGMVRARIGGPEAERHATAGRYLALRGCMAHSCMDRALVWADAQAGTSAFAINSFRVPGSDKECFAVGSRSLGEKDLPAAFQETFQDWKAHHQDLAHDCTTFIDGRGRTPKVTTMGATPK